jgi:hypothetical protein
MKRSLTRLPWVALTALLLGAPAGLLVGLLLGQERLSGLDQAPAPFVEPARAVEFDERTGIAATLTWAPGPRLYAPPWSGTVGQVQLQPGQTLRTGDPVATVSAVARVAVRSAQPFFRPLALGDQGADVTWLHEALALLGYRVMAPEDDATVGQSTLAAVRALAADLGVMGRVDAFDPGWIVWLPDEPFQVDSVALTAGAPAMSTGTELAAGAPILTAVRFQRLDGSPLALEPGIRYVLEMGGEELPLDSTTSSVGNEGLRRLAKVLPPLADSASGSMRRAEPLNVWALPSAAVMAGPNGQLCIWIQTETRYEAVTVQIVSGRAGITFVMPPRSSVPVLQNPAETLVEPACPSG